MHPSLAKPFESGKACTAAQIDRTYEDLPMKDYRPAGQKRFLLEIVRL